jgi:hypothetical protein
MAADDISDKIRLHSKSRKKINIDLDKFTPSLDRLGILDSLAENKSFIPEIIPKLCEFMGKIRRQEDLVYTAQKIFNFCSVIGQQSDAMRTVKVLFDKYSLWETVDMSLIIDYLFLTAMDRLDVPIATDRFKRFMQKEGEDETYYNNAARMTAIKSFSHNTVLEPRVVVNSK